VDVEALTLEAGGRAGADHRCPRTSNDGHDRCIVGDGAAWCWTPSRRGEALWPGRIASGGGGLLGHRMVWGGGERRAASSWTPSRPVKVARSWRQAAACRESGGGRRRALGLR
jgi:hypothetical protein